MTRTRRLEELTPAELRDREARLRARLRELGEERAPALRADLAATVAERDRRAGQVGLFG